jgi:hypothetical protein
MPRFAASAHNPCDYREDESHRANPHDTPTTVPRVPKMISSVRGHREPSGFLSEERTQTLLCGDIYTQGGAEHPPLTESDILDPSEAFRREMDWDSNRWSPRVKRRRLS